MTCEDLRPEYGTFALGITEGPERAEILGHLERRCPKCVPGVRSALATVAAMSGAVPLVDPPLHLRTRVIAMVSRDSAPNESRFAAPARSRFSMWFPWTVAGALALVLLSVAVPSRIRRTSDPEINQARLQEALAIINDPVTRDVVFGDPAARGRFFVSANRGVVFLAAHMPKLDKGRTFEMWLIPSNGKPVPAGTFNALPDSTALYLHSGPLPVTTAMAISVEPAGGSPQPTTTPIIVSKL